MTDDVKRGRGRPRKDGAKRKRINLLVSDEFYEELKELSELEGQSRTDYIIDSVRAYSALTRARYAEEDDNEADFYTEDGNFYDN